MSDQVKTVQDILLEAVEIADAREQAAFLSKACGTDLALRQEVEELLQAEADAGQFLPEIPGTSAAQALLAGAAEALAPNAGSPQVPLTEKPGDRIGRYKLLQKIGEGGCGVVYMAEQEEPIRRKVALKVIKLGMDTKQVIVRFEAERQSLALMDHPNIAKVLDAGATDTGRPYFVMELVYGIKITDYCDQNHLSTRERLDLFVQACHAIQHAHQKGIIHRDIKPSNILVTLRDGVPVPKVIDFGIAKATTDQRLTDKTLFTQFAMFVGTPAYMSPEQAEMSELGIDTRSDIYSLGILLYELLTGRTPFEARELMQAGLDEIRRIIREQEPPRPSTRLSTMTAADLIDTAKHRHVEPAKLCNLIRGDLDWIVMKALAKERGRRYETANGLAMDVGRYLTGQLVLARPPSRLYEFQKTFLRHKVGFAATAAVIAALALGVLASTLEAIRARTAERGESRSQQRAEKEAQRAKESELAARQEAYAADMNLAQQAWEQNSVGRVRQLLEDTAAYPQRGFEWYYWQRQTHLALKTLRGHFRGVECVAFSPDGQRIVTGSKDGTAKVWEAASGRELLTLKGHTADVSFVAFSPDGQRIVTGSFDYMAKVWQAASGRLLLTLQGPREEIWSVAFSPDGQRIVTGSGNQMARVWEAASGRELLTLKGHSLGINSVAFSPDGQRIVTGSDDQTAKVWEAASGRELLTLKGHNGEIVSAAFSPDGQRIVTGSSDQTAKVWEASSGKAWFTFTGHVARVSSVAFSPDGQRIVSGSGDQTARVWEAASGRELITLKGHSLGVTCVAFSPDGQRILTGSHDKTAKVWEAASGLSADKTGQNPIALKGHSNRDWPAAFSPDGQRMVTVSSDQTVKVREAASGRELFTLKGHTDRIWSVAFSPDGQRIVTASSDQTAKVWDAATGQKLLTLKGHNAAITCVAFSPDGQRIVTGSEDHTARVWEAASGRELLTLKGHRGPITSVAFCPDGQRIVTGSEGERARVWEAARAGEVATWQAEELAAAQSLAGFQRELMAEQERQRIARAGDAGAIKQWLILAPIALATNQSGAQGLDLEQVEGEGRLRPKAGETKSFENGELRWRAVGLEDSVIDFNAILERVTELSVAYAICYIRSETEQRGLRMLVGSDDEAKVYLNGRQVHKSPSQRGFVADEDKVPDIALNAGLNVLVFKVVNETFGWLGSIRFTDAQGNPVKGIKVTLDPEGKDFP